MLFTLCFFNPRALTFTNILCNINALYDYRVIRTVIIAENSVWYDYARALKKECNSEENLSGEFLFIS